MCRDSGDTTSKVSCCVKPSQCFKKSDSDASRIMPLELPLKKSLPKNESTDYLKSASFVVIIRLNENLAHTHSPKQPRLHFGESFTLSKTAHD